MNVDAPETASSRATPMIATIGYERAALDDFIRTLRDAGIAILFDVRANAWSRRPEFGARKLADALAGVGIGYHHLPALGSPEPARAAAAAGDGAGFERHYRAQLETAAARAALDEILAAASDVPVCLMCYERDVRDCHRRMTVVPLAAATGQPPRHLTVASPPPAGSLL